MRPCWSHSSPLRSKPGGLHRPSPAGRSRTCLSPRIRRVPFRPAPAGKQFRRLESNQLPPVFSGMLYPLSYTGARASGQIPHSFEDRAAVKHGLPWNPPSPCPLPLKGERVVSVGTKQMNATAARRCFSTLTWIRTRNGGFEARNDIRFTIRAVRGRAPSAGFEPAISGLKGRRPLRRHHEGELFPQDLSGRSRTCIAATGGWVTATWARQCPADRNDPEHTLSKRPRWDLNPRPPR